VLDILRRLIALCSVIPGHHPFLALPIKSHH
jgi:hypothetical protein